MQSAKLQGRTSGTSSAPCMASAGAVAPAITAGMTPPSARPRASTAVIAGVQTISKWSAVINFLVLRSTVWRTRATLMGVFASLFKVCFSFIYRYECFKTLSYTFTYFLLLLLYCYFTSFYTDHSDRLGS